MSFKMINYKPGDVLGAEQVNLMQSTILANESLIAPVSKEVGVLSTESEEIKQQVVALQSTVNGMSNNVTKITVYNCTDLADYLSKLINAVSGQATNTTKTYWFKGLGVAPTVVTVHKGYDDDNSQIAIAYVVGWDGESSVLRFKRTNGTWDVYNG